MEHSLEHGDARYGAERQYSLGEILKAAPRVGEQYITDGD